MRSAVQLQDRARQRRSSLWFDESFAHRAIEQTLEKSRAIITELLGERELALGPGDLRREAPARIDA